MRIGCIIDSKYKVQHNRIRVLSRLFPNIRFDSIIPSKNLKINTKKYDVFYYASFSLYERLPIRHSHIYGSITSHKCLRTMNKTLRLLKKFNRISVNNKILYNIFSSRRDDIYYIPNGVDVNTFTFKGNTLYNPNNIKLGWVGNVDRATKNFKSIILPMTKFKGFTMFRVDASKSKPLPKKTKNMVKFYHNLDFYIVSSTTEGTPNPALEAASCGVPLICTEVGNMPELVEDKINGFFVDYPKIHSFKDVLYNKVKQIDIKQYNNMSHRIHLDISLSWSWKLRRDKYLSFFIK